MRNVFTFLIFLCVAASSALAETVSHNRAVGATAMSAYMTFTNTTTTQQRTDRKISFSWAGNIQKTYGGGTNGALVSIAYQLENTTKTGWLNETWVLQNNANSNFNTDSSGSVVSPTYAVGTTYVDVRIIAYTTVSATRLQDMVTVRVYLTDAAPQIVTVTPSSISLLSGQSQTFTATGGNNGYEWSLSGGGTLASDGASALFIASTPGSWTVTVSSPAGSGYLASNTATATITVGESNRVRVSLRANNGSWPVEYVVMQNGEAVATYTQMPGDAARIINQVVPGTGPVTVLSRQIGLHQEDNGVWTVNPDGAGPVSTSPEITPEATPEPDPVEVTPPAGPTSPPPTAGDQSDKPVWSTPAPNTDPSAQTDLVTNATFREGVDKIVEPLNAWQRAREKAKADAKAMSDSWFGSSNSEFSEAEWAAAKSRLETVAQTNMSELTDKIPTSATVTSFSLGDDEISLAPDFTLKAAGVTIATFEFKPFKKFPWLKTGLLVIREIILWGMGWMFYAAAQAKLERIQFALSLVPQADVQGGEAIQVYGNQVPGTSTAIALGKRVLVAGAIIGVIHIELAALIVVWNTRIGEVFGSGWSFADIGNIANIVNAQSGGHLGTAARIMDTVFPLTAGVAFIVAWFLFSWACIATYAAASAAAKSLKI